jgi:rfaE bifunctional protein nucleotidyltransferase chain/domain
MIITLKDLPNIRSHYKDQKIVYIGGTFDLLHFGHVRSFEEAKKLGDVLVVSVDSDEATWHYKTKDRPIINEEQRASMVDALKAVDYVIINPLGDISKHPYNEMNVIEELRPDIFVTSHTEGWKPIFEQLKGSKPAVVGFKHDLVLIHTSDIISKIRSTKAG